MLKNPNDLISIIVPVYNVADFLYSCIASIQNQTYRNLEIILVDDGSTDSSSEICDELASKDSRISVIHQQNAGLSGARNTGIKHATGKWSMYLDSDDSLDGRCIEWLYYSVATTNSDMAIGSFSLQSPNDISAVHTLRPFDSKQIHTVNSQTAVCEIFSENVVSTAAWAKLALTEIWKNCLFPEGQYYEDLCTTWKAISMCNSISIVPLPVYHYTKRDSSITSAPNINRLFDYDKSIKSMLSCVTKSYGIHSKVQTYAQFRACLEYSRLIEALYNPNITDGASRQILLHQSATYIRNNWSKSLCASKAPITQRIRILLVALSPSIASSIRRRVGSIGVHN